MKGTDARRTMMKLEGSFHLPDDPSTPYNGRSQGSSRVKNQTTKQNINHGGGRGSGSQGSGGNGYCFGRNNGGCTDGRTCPNGFEHVCQICRRRHRKSECTTAPKKSGGKNKGKGRKGGGKGKGRGK